MPGKPGYSAIGSATTIAAWLAAIFATIMLTADAADAFAAAFRWADYAVCIKIIALYLPIYFLMYGTFSYLCTRYGYFSRAEEHSHRTTEIQIKRLYNSSAPELVILVPSYKEEKQIIWQTLFSAALVEYPSKRVVLLLDDPPNPTAEDDIRKREAAHEAVQELATLLKHPATRLSQELSSFEERCRHGLHDRAFETGRIAHLYREAADWLECQAEQLLDGRASEMLDRTDRF